MSTEQVATEYYESSRLAKYPFEPYWPAQKLRICVTGAGGFIASHLAKRLRSEGHYIVAADWKRNSFLPVRCFSTILLPHRAVRVFTATARHCGYCASLI